MNCRSDGPPEPVRVVVKRVGEPAVVEEILPTVEQVLEITGGVNRIQVDLNELDGQGSDVVGLWFGNDDLPGPTPGNFTIPGGTTMFGTVIFAHLENGMGSLSKEQVTRIAGGFEACSLGDPLCTVCERADCEANGEHQEALGVFTVELADVLDAFPQLSRYQARHVLHDIGGELEGAAEDYLQENLFEVIRAAADDIVTSIKKAK